MGDRIFEALAHPLRRRALRILGERPRMYSELMEELGVDSPHPGLPLEEASGACGEGGQRILPPDGPREEGP